MVYRGYYYEKNLCVMITHYNVFRRFFRTSYIVAITYEQNMNSWLTFRLFAQLSYDFIIFYWQNRYLPYTIVRHHYSFLCTQKRFSRP